MSRGSQKDEPPANQVAKKAMNDKGMRRNGARYQTYAQLSDSRDKIFNTKTNMEEFGRPPLLRTPMQARNPNKFCTYHNEAGYHTANCFELKDAIEDLIRRGRLRDYVRRPRNQSQQQLQ
ncbi:hypothetical protein ACOSQ3_009784 [Xanthoceras sorbifolium]